MRGPGLKSTLDVRRLWRCPACGYERHVGQATTSVLCFCKDPPIQMKLIEGKRVVRPEPRPVARFIDESELPPEETTPQAPVIRAIDVVAVEVVVETVVETVIETAGPAAPPEPPASPSAKKRRRRSKGRREVSDGPSSSGPPASASPEEPAPQPPETPDFGEGIAP